MQIMQSDLDINTAYEEDNKHQQLDNNKQQQLEQSRKQQRAII